MRKFLEEVQSFLKSEFRELNIVVMPDFFLDRLISLDWDTAAFSKQLKGIVERKGGSIDGVKQAEFRGGNAINTASALAALGTKVTPIVCTDKLGFQLIKYYLGKYNIDFSHVKIFGKLSMTTSIELKTEYGRANVMLRDVGGLSNFGPQHLSSEDYEAVENADYVCVFNWAGTKLFGTELAETVFCHVKTKGKGKTYCDTADPTPNARRIPELVKNVLQGKHLDILSLNENEAICYASQLKPELKRLKKNLRVEDLAMESARILASHLSARVDLHTTSFSATITKKGETVVPTFKVPALRATGAGDAWNAGNILGDAHRLSDGCRLALANAVASYYISSPNHAHPTKKELIKYCEKLRRTC